MSQASAVLDTTVAAPESKQWTLFFILGAVCLVLNTGNFIFIHQSAVETVNFKRYAVLIISFGLKFNQIKQNKKRVWIFFLYIIMNILYIDIFSSGWHIYYPFPELHKVKNLRIWFPNDPPPMAPRHCKCPKFTLTWSKIYAKKCCVNLPLHQSYLTTKNSLFK